MTTDRADEILAAWDELARSARARHKPARMRSKFQLPGGALVLGSIVLALALAQPLLRPGSPLTPASPASSSPVGQSGSAGPTEAEPSTTPTGAGALETPKPYEATFGPVFAAAPASQQFVRVDDAVLSDDSLMLTITFVGGAGYTRAGFCSSDYAPWVGATGDELDVAVAVVPHPDQATGPPNVGCADIGHGYTYHLRLAAPFAGSTVNDLAGGTLWVREPTGLVTIGALPRGWELRLAEDVPGAQPPLWARVYAPAGKAIQAPNLGPGQLDLYQAFGAPTNIGGGSQRQDVFVNDAPAVLLHDPDLGEWLLQWVVAGDGVALVGNEADLTLDQFLDIARAIEPAT
jgi:hypothetical protein